MSCYNYPPGPSQRLFFGNTHNVDLGNLHTSLWDHKELYGELSYFKIGSRHIVSLNSLHAIRETLTSDDVSKFVLNRGYSFINRYITPNEIALSDYSEDWHHLRSTALKGVLSSLSEPEVLCAFTEETAALNKAFAEKGDNLFDPKELLSVSVMNGVLTSMVAKRFQYGHKIFDLFDYYDAEVAAIFTTSARMWLGLIPALRFLPFGYGKHCSNVLDVKEKLAEEILYPIRKENEIAQQARKGLIYELLRESKTHPSITDNHIKDIILNVHSAGIGSIRGQLYALIYLLIHHSEIQNKLYTEIIEKSAIDPLKRGTKEHRNQLPYVQAVITESLRITSLVPNSVPRSASQDIKLLGYHLRKDTVLMPNIWRVHHDEEQWEEPWCFKPERFIDDDGGLIQQKVNDVIPFGLGQRSCLGESLTWSRIFLYVIDICKAFELCKDEDEQYTDVRKWVRDTVIYAPLKKLRVKARE